MLVRVQILELAELDAEGEADGSTAVFTKFIDQRPHLALLLLKGLVSRCALEAQTEARSQG